MTWATTKEAVRLAVAAALSLPDETGSDGVVGGVHVVEWVNKRSANRFMSTSVDLQLNNPVAQGRDETRYELIEGATVADNKLIPTYGGRRIFSVMVQISAESQEDGEEAVGQLAGQLRTRLKRPEILGILQDDLVALRSIGPSIPADYRNRDGHWLSASVTELFLACTESDTDDDNAGDYIASAEGTGDLTTIDSVVIEAAFDSLE